MIMHIVCPNNVYLLYFHIWGDHFLSHYYWIQNYFLDAYIQVRSCNPIFRMALFVFFLLSSVYF